MCQQVLDALAATVDHSVQKAPLAAQRRPELTNKRAHVERDIGIP